jgi:hypothetical protein
MGVNYPKGEPSLYCQHCHRRISGTPLSLFRHLLGSCPAVSEDVLTDLRRIFEMSTSRNKNKSYVRCLWWDTADDAQSAQKRAPALEQPLNHIVQRR